jgi:O-antigen/teichoic acid export membrane protein
VFGHRCQGSPDSTPRTAADRKFVGSGGFDVPAPGGPGRASGPSPLGGCRRTDIHLRRISVTTPRRLRVRIEMSSGATPSLLRNTAAQSGPLVLGYVLSFLSAPIILAGLGIREFGIWALTGALASYASLLDLGFGGSVSRFIAANQDDRGTCGEYIALALLGVACVGVLALGAAFMGAVPLSRALGGITSSDMRIVLLSAAVLLVTAMLSNIVAAFAIGHCRMVAPNLGFSLGVVVNFMASVVSIALGADLAWYAVANAGAGIVTLSLVSGLVLNAEGSIPLSLPRRGGITEFFRYSVKAQMTRLTDLINYETDKIVIAFSVGPSAAGAYELANRVAVAARQPGVYALSALVPTLTINVSRLGLDHVRRQYARLMEVASAGAFPSLLLAAALAPLLLGAWLSHVPAEAVAILAALSLAYIANVSSGVGYVVGLAAGDPGVAARAAAGTAVANVIFTVVLAPIFGLWGVLAGTVVALTGGALVQVTMVHHRFLLTFAAYRNAVVPTLGVCALLAAPVAVVSYSGMISGRGWQACAVIALASAYLLLFGRWAISAGRLPRQLVQRISGISLAVRRRIALGTRDAQYRDCKRG